MRRDEAGESEGGISYERLSKISGLLWRGELGARPSRSAGLRAVVKLCSQSHSTLSALSARLKAGATCPTDEGRVSLTPLI